MPTYSPPGDTSAERTEAFTRLVSDLLTAGVDFQPIGGLRIEVDDETFDRLTGEAAPAPAPAPRPKATPKGQPKAKKAPAKKAPAKKAGKGNAS